MTSSFVHLHVHSQFTLLGATATIDELVTRASAEGMTHLALTDTWVLYGAVRFARACAKVGIQPIIGMTVPVAYQGESAVDAGVAPGPLVLLARNPDGYRSLSNLSSAIQSRKHKTHSTEFAVNLDTIDHYQEGLICLSGGRQGWIERYLAAGRDVEAARFTSRLAGIFGEAFYLSLERHERSGPDLLKDFRALSDGFGVPLVAVQPIYCLQPNDRNRLPLLAAIRSNCLLEEVKEVSLPDQGDRDVDLHWVSQDEMDERFQMAPDALAETGRIAARCAPALPDGSPIWPSLDLEGGQTADEALKTLAFSGAYENWGQVLPKAVGERLQRELDVIARHGFAPLFLIVADVVRYARAQEILFSTRGSVANSLAAYCSGITTVDPINHDLLFERFLNPARSNPPDIDLDFCSRRRDEVLSYVRRKYGEKKVALVATVSTLRPKSAVRATAKAYGLSDAEIRSLSKRLPRGWHPDPRRRQKLDIDDVMAGIEDGVQQSVIKDAYAIVGQPHHLSVHPGGVVVSPGPMTDIVPLQWSPKGFLITQYDHDDVEAIGLPKLDLLGIRALTVLADTASLVQSFHDPAFALEQIAVDDVATGDLLEMGDTIGVFQCDSSGAQKTLRRLKARSIEDLAIANAFFKPGPATGGMAQSFVRRYRGEEAVHYLHPSLEPILGKTKGVIIFQEQILRIVREIAGLSWEQADHIRRGMSRFRSEDMAAMQSAFLQGCLRTSPDGPGMSQAQATTLWEQVQAFSGYGFNQGHATAYADVSFRSAYMKEHFPAAFFCARLAGWGGFHHPAVYMAEARRLGLAVRPPHVNYSGFRFTLAFEGGPARVSQPVLWMGLGQVRDLRDVSVQVLVRERQLRPFTDVRDLLARVSLQAKEIRHLIKSGALDGLGPHRNAMLDEVELMTAGGDARQLSFDFAHSESLPESPVERLQWELALLGYPMSKHPLDVESPSPDSAPLSRVMEMRNRRVLTAGVRLPGWTGGRGFFLSDPGTYVHAIPRDERLSVSVWKPVAAVGVWRQDEWGTAWFDLEKIKSLT